MGRLCKATKLELDYQVAIFILRNLKTSISVIIALWTSSLTLHVYIKNQFEFKIHKYFKTFL